MLKTIKNIIKILLLVLLIILIGLYFFGCRYMFVLTQSMEPTIKVNDLVITKPVEFNELKEKDIITINFDGNKSVRLTHRITRIDKENKLLYTKGDNNPTGDRQPSEYKDVVGKVIFTIPKLGVLISFFKTPVGIGCLIVLLAIIFVFDSLSSKKEKRLIH